MAATGSDNPDHRAVEAQLYLQDSPQAPVLTGGQEQTEQHLEGVPGVGMLMATVHGIVLF